MRRIALIVITIILFPIFILQAFGGTTLNINNATVDLEAETLTLHGSHFDIGPLDIRIGDTYLSDNCTITPTLTVKQITDNIDEIVAQLGELDLRGWSKTSISDIVLMLGWYMDFKHMLG